MNHYYGLVKSASQVSGSGGGEVLSFAMQVDGVSMEVPDPVVPQGAEATVQLRIRIADGCQGQVTIMLDDATLAPVLAVPVLGQDGEFIELPAGEHSLTVPIGKLELNAGKYAVLVNVRDARYNTNLCRHQGLQPFRIQARRVLWAKVIRTSVSVRNEGTGGLV